MKDQNKMGVIRSMKYTLRTIWEADKGAVIYSFYKNCTEEVFATFFFIYLLQYIYSAIEEGKSYEGLVRMVVIFCGLHIVIHLVSAGYAYYIRLRTPKIYGHVFRKVITKAKTIELARYEQPDFYDRFSKALDECLSKAIEGMQNLTWAIGCFLAAVAGLGLVARVDPVLLLFVVPPVLSSFWIGGRLNKLQYQLREEETRDKRINEYVKRVFYEKKYASELRLYDIKKLLFRKHTKSYENRFEINRRISRKLSWYSFLQSALFFGLTLLMAYLYVTVVLKTSGATKIGAYVAILSSIEYICWRVKETVKFMNLAGKSCMYMNNLKDFLEYESKEQQVGTRDVDQPLGDIDMKDVTFTYAGAKNPVINGLSLHIKQGEKIALVGENGAGKTTLVKLLMGLYEIQQGSITINGIDIREFQQDQFHQHFGTVFQDLQIFALPLSHNVLMREPKDEMERKLVKDALEKAQFGDKLKRLPNGIDTMLTKEFDTDGFVTSGGQAQKIAIARVFAKNPDIVILDEPSSALDPIAEYLMYDNMLHASKGKTVFFISHRLSSARIADRIFYLEHGQIKECGSHDELMKKNGNYANMFRVQATQYKETISSDILDEFKEQFEGEGEFDE